VGAVRQSVRHLPVHILVLNVGSSSLKFQLIDTDDAAIAGARDRRLARGQIERIGGEAVLTLTAGDDPSATSAAPIANHASAIAFVIRWLTTSRSEDAPAITRVADIQAVGHRVVHGGEKFKRSTLVTDEIRRKLEDLIELAPLHNPHNLRGIEAARAALGTDVPQVAVFDTAFHHSLPERAHLYALPYQLYRRHGVRRYGFHGTSHRYIAHRYRELTGTSRDDTKIITLHLGNGASALIRGSRKFAGIGKQRFADTPPPPPMFKRSGWEMMPTETCERGVAANDPSRPHGRPSRVFHRDPRTSSPLSND